MTAKLVTARYRGKGARAREDLERRRRTLSRSGARGPSPAANTSAWADLEHDEEPQAMIAPRRDTG